MKKFRLPVVLLLLLFTAGVSRAQTLSVSSHADTQSWNDIQVAIPVNDRLESCCLVRRTSVVTSQTLSMNEPG